MFVFARWLIFCFSRFEESVHRCADIVLPLFDYEWCDVIIRHPDLQDGFESIHGVDRDVDSSSLC